MSAARRSQARACFVPSASSRWSVLSSSATASDDGRPSAAPRASPSAFVAALAERWSPRALHAALATRSWLVASRAFWASSARSFVSWAFSLRRRRRWSASVAASVCGTAGGARRLVGGFGSAKGGGSRVMGLAAIVFRARQTVQPSNGELA